ncbi:MAG: 2OG-Fe(II) oxygenase [Hyphomicrobiales bacterium]
MKHLDIAALKSAKLRHDPFEYTIVPGFLNAASLRKVISTYPDIMKGGSYPLDTVNPGPDLQSVIDEMDSPEFERVIEEKFDVRLKGQPKMYSLRGYCRGTDGKIHTDSRDKIITVLLYLNDKWNEPGGKLRMLRTGTDLEDFSEEVPPDNGTLLVFRRSDRSWHGHGSFDGVRRSIQMNWMVSEGRKGFHAFRHKLSARFKKLVSA